MKFAAVLLLLFIALSLQGCGGGSGGASLESTLPKTNPTLEDEVENPTPEQFPPGILGDLVDLGDLVAPDGNPPPGDGWYFTESLAINDDGIVVGHSNQGGPHRAAFRWDPDSGLMTFLGIHSRFYDDPYDINFERSELPRKSFRYSKAVDINQSGIIIGNSTRGEDEKRAFVWVDGAFIDLCPPPFETLGPKFKLPDQTTTDGIYVVTKSFSEAVDINNRGEVVLTMDDATGRHAYYWDGVNFFIATLNYYDEEGPTGPIDVLIPRLVGLGRISNEDSYAVAINENGQAVANSGDTAVFTDLNWDVIEPLNHLPGKAKTVAVDINDSIYTNNDGIPDGHVIGNSGNGNLKIEEDDTVQGFFWDGGAMYPIGHLGGGTSVATDINNKDQVVGGATTADGSIHAYIWTLDSNKKGISRDLGTLGGENSFATAINELGQVIGWSETGDFYEEQGIVVPIRHAFLWQDGIMYDLGTHDNFYQYPFTPPFPFSETAAINNNGQVAGNSLTINEHSRGFFLTPVFP